MVPFASRTGVCSSKHPATPVTPPIAQLDSGAAAGSWQRAHARASTSGTVTARGGRNAPAASARAPAGSVRSARPSGKNVTAPWP